MVMNSLIVTFFTCKRKRMYNPKFRDMNYFRLPLLVAFLANAFLISAQNVGIGVERPGSKLSVAGGISIGENFAGKTAPDGSILIEKSMGIGTDTIDPNVVLDIRSTTKGVLFPTMNTSMRNSIINPPKGLFVFNEDSSGFNFYNGASWLNFALLGPTGPVGAAASLLGLNGSQAGGYAATSASLTTVGTGTKVFVTQAGLAYRANDRVRISAAANKYMEGTVTTYLAGVLTVNVDRVVGNGSSLSWSIGLAGDVGATGPTGSAGAQGPTGAAGAQGVQGLKGNTGATGATGAQGAQGVAGPAGAQGIQGVAGATGAVGPQGPAGAAGAQGPQGLKGNTGATGATGAQGIQGPAGAAGAQGPQGLKGATGATGAAGSNGTVGAQGPAGPAGSNGTAWHTGSGVPASGTGVQNDMYLNTSNGTYYRKGASSWGSSLGSLKGATGAQGPAGANGSAGSNGTMWHTGNSAPGSGVGAVNDLYINSSNGTYYKKTGASTWASQGSLKGPAGTLANGSAAGNTPYWNGTTWVLNNSNIFNNGANVGIGTTSPAHKLEVMNGNLSVDNTNNTAGSLIMYEPSNSGTNFTAFKARAQAADITYNLPVSQSANTVLINDGAGNLTWTPVNSTVTTMFEKKNANESVTNNSLQDDNDFIYTLEANQSYEVSGLIRISAHADGEWAFKFIAPSQTQTLISMAYNTEYLDEMMYVTSPNTTYYMLNDGANPNADVVFVNGMVTTGSQGGTFKFQWAQRYTNSTATTIYANSYIRLTRAQ